MKMKKDMNGRKKRMAAWLLMVSLCLASCWGPGESVRVKADMDARGADSTVGGPVIEAAVRKSSKNKVLRCFLWMSIYGRNEESGKAVSENEPVGNGASASRGKKGTGRIDHGLQNPRTDQGVTTWDCVYFGNYWQEDTNGDGKADKGDDKTPIKWRVLSIEGDDAFLMADQNLDCQSYHSQCWQVTWENCTMRSWLNGYGAEANKAGTDYGGDGFLNNAFGESERQAIMTTTVANLDNANYGISGGNDTSDQIYLLSWDELINSAYGFLSAADQTDTRWARNTAYTAAGGEIQGDMQDAGQLDYWWSRSPGRNSSAAVIVWTDGTLNENYLVNYVQFAVRPVLHLNLAAMPGVWTDAGTVTAGKSLATPEPTHLPTSTQMPTTAPTRMPATAPTQMPTSAPSRLPTSAPGQLPTLMPTSTPAQLPTLMPNETTAPTGRPTVSNAPDASATAGPTSDASSGTEDKEVGAGESGGNSAGGNGSDVGETGSAGTKEGVSSGGKNEGSHSQTKIPKVKEVKKLKVRGKKRGLVLTWKKDGKVSGYQIQAGRKKNFKGAKKKIVKKSKNKLIISGLKSGKNYYIRIRAYKNYKTWDGKSKRKYGKWSVKRGSTKRG